MAILTNLPISSSISPVCQYINREIYPNMHIIGFFKLNCVEAYDLSHLGYVFKTNLQCILQFIFLSYVPSNSLYFIVTFIQLIPFLNEMH